MRLDEIIEQFDLYIKKKNGYGTLDDDELRQISKWLKELKKWRRGEMHCKSHSERAMEKYNIGYIR